MLRLSLISLLLLSVGSDLEKSAITAAQSTPSTAVPSLSTKPSLNARTSLHAETTPRPGTLTHSSKMPTPGPSSPTLSPRKPTHSPKMPIPRPSSPTPKPGKPTHSATTPRRQSAVTSKTATTLTTQINGCTKLKPMENLHFLFYVMFLLFCVHSG